MTTPRCSALLLIAHGSRRSEANLELHAVAESLRERGHYEIVQPSFWNWRNRASRRVG
ncbi:MAG: hypothetical protein U0792_18985 [Gemmataceae bacterium]